VTILHWAGRAPKPYADPLRGWHCAAGTLVTPLGSFVWGHFRGEGLLVGVYKDNPLLLVATMFSGLINPLFLITLVQVIRDRQRSVGYLRIVLALMVVGSAIVIDAHSYVPREGFVLWIVGMVLVAWSADLARLLRLDQRLR
jgi:hypothetical protein